jgi:hypothetical protein
MAIVSGQMPPGTPGDWKREAAARARDTILLRYPLGRPTEYESMAACLLAAALDTSWATARAILADDPHSPMSAMYACMAEKAIEHFAYLEILREERRWGDAADLRKVIGA